MSAPPKASPAQRVQAIESQIMPILEVAIPTHADFARLQGLLDELIAAQGGVMAQFGHLSWDAATAGQRYHDLEDWLERDFGVDLSRVHVVHGLAEGAGLALGSRKADGAHISVSPGDPLLSIPLSAILTADGLLAGTRLAGVAEEAHATVPTNLNNPAAVQLFRDHLRLTNDHSFRLAVGLCLTVLDNLQGSPFLPYIRALPGPEAACCFLFAGAADAQALFDAGSPTGGLLFARLAGAFRAYQCFLRLASGAGKAASPGWALFRWAWAQVLSRQNLLPVGATGSHAGNGRGPEALPCLVPLWDLINHASRGCGPEGTDRPEISSFVQQTEQDPAPMFVFHALYPAAGHGAPVHMFYGDRSNRDFWLYQGFTVPAPVGGQFVPQPTALLRFDLNRNEPPETLRTRSSVLSSLGFSLPHFSVVEFRPESGSIQGNGLREVLVLSSILALGRPDLEEASRRILEHGLRPATVLEGFAPDQPDTFVLGSYERAVQATLIRVRLQLSRMARVAADIDLAEADDRHAFQGKLLDEARAGLGAAWPALLTATPGSGVANSPLRILYQEKETLLRLEQALLALKEACQ
ncbi:hypothetical protein H696_05023 [Fonticula alba]|uniref:Uncharacterized protein n=1 Tax=Fonticula alba TaxID=691883 RepID=A0A058Z5C7_FONAL|nr:hypothetical protein H696_05023 [Fonticula alba]KCV68737.1 hypothetical protein H696_05023 [Fonticula alba]|eukprot:XP_009497169.1 hypothetical protein H696_05023 [Fonticula alba]